MPIPRFIAVPLASFLAFIFPVALHAQVVVRSGSGGGAVRDDNAYTITEKSTTVQKLVNGVTITHETISKTARDSSGRTYDENQVRPDLTIWWVNDPVNHTTMNWTSQSKEVVIIHEPEPDSTPAAHVSPPPPPPQVQVRTQTASKPQVEDLGTKTILGMTVTGKRITRTIPAGREGNDQPFTVTTEVWYTPELGINLLQINDDPRSGTTTIEVTDVQRGEPDPSLFQIPEGYSVKDVYPGQTN